MAAPRPPIPPLPIPENTDPLEFLAGRIHHMLDQARQGRVVPIEEVQQNIAFLADYSAVRASELLEQYARRKRAAQAGATGGDPSDGLPPG
jgi:hypothetical protein